MTYEQILQKHNVFGIWMAWLATQFAEHVVTAVRAASEMEISNLHSACISVYLRSGVRRDDLDQHFASGGTTPLLGGDQKKLTNLEFMLRAEILNWSWRMYRNYNGM